MLTQAPLQVPSNNRVPALVIDDDPLQLQLVEEALQDFELTIHLASNCTTALELVTQYRPRLVFLDLVMPDMNGMEMLETLLHTDPTVDVILITAHYSTESAVEAIQKGAYDYLTKPLPIKRLREKVDIWLQQTRKREHAAILEADMISSFQFEGIIGRSPAMQEVFSKIQRLAPHYSTALITGDTGTGKELVAKALHRLSPRSSGPFVVCNCAAIPENLFDTELFGHVRGSFTGAVRDKVGFIEQANRGTIFLDEVGELPAQVQAKLLRVLQNREIQRVGADGVTRVDVRIIAATNRHLPTMVQEKSFREDIYYRLAMVEIRLPRLMDRKEDVPLLSQSFIRKFSERYGKPTLRLTRRAELLLSRYPWPGNVRELENALDFACMMARGNIIDVYDFPEMARVHAESNVETSEIPVMPLEELERKYIMQVLERFNGNMRRTAEVLGISRSTIYRIRPKVTGDN